MKGGGSRIDLVRRGRVSRKLTTLVYFTKIPLNVVGWGGVIRISPQRPQVEKIVCRVLLAAVRFTCYRINTYNNALLKGRENVISNFALRYIMYDVIAWKILCRG